MKVDRGGVGGVKVGGLPKGTEAAAASSAIFPTKFSLCDSLTVMRVGGKSMYCKCDRSKRLSSRYMSEIMVVCHERGFVRARDSKETELGFQYTAKLHKVVILYINPPGVNPPPVVLWSPPSDTSSSSR